MLSPLRMYLNLPASAKLFPVRLLFLWATAFAWLLHPGISMAQQADPFFIQHLDNRNGLSNSAINHIFQDSENIIWVATWDGLNMYDGTEFHVFNHSKENDFKSIGSNVIQQVAEDKKRNIWIGTIEGISRYEKHSGKFYNYFYDLEQRSPVSEQDYQLAIDHSGRVFCLTRKYGLTYYDALADTFRRASLPSGALQQNGASTISNLLFDGSGNLWLLNSKGGLERFREEKQHQFKKLKTYRENTPIVNLFHADKRMFYTTADNRLYGIDPQSLLPETLLQTDHRLSSIIRYNDYYLLAWSGKGYSVYDRHFKPSAFLGDQVKKMRDIKITSWASGSEQILWYGTDGNGIIKLYPKTKFFATVTTSDNGMPYNKAVRAFCEENGNLWVGTKGSGIIKYSNFTAGDKASLKKENFLAGAQLDNNSVYALKKGSDDLIYIGTDGKGLGIYDVKLRVFRKWAQIQGSGNYPEFGSVYAILQDGDNSVWLGTSGYGLVHLKISRDPAGKLSVGFLERFTFDNTSSGPANNIIYALAEGDDDHLWVACRYGGLSLLDKKSRKFKTFKAFTYEGSLSNNDVLSLYKDRQNRVWIGTSYGLNWIDQKEASLDKPVFKKLTTADGLPNNTIHAIEEDRSGNIWVSTNKGLARIKPSDLDISRYQQIDGLQSNEFSDGAVWKGADGQLFFGGIYGFNYFLPKNIQGTKLRPNLLVSGIQLGGDLAYANTQAVLTPAGSSALAYSLERKNNYFEVQLRAISFLNAEKCEYAYYLAGNDQDWHYSGTAGKILYSNIPPGKYRLMVKWSNGEGVWTSGQKVFDLEVKQYLWLTWPAFLLYALVAFAGSYVIYNYRKNKNEIRQQLTIEHMLRQKEEELHQEQLGFYTNITHELQTPLTLIMGSTERFLEKIRPGESQQDRPYFLSLIHQQASRLTYLVQQLLEFRKAEAGFLEKHYSILEISRLIENLSALFVPLSEQKDMTYTRHIAPDISGLADKDKLEKIMFNLLSNAFRHSGDQEEVFLSIEENRQDKVLEIIVANSGCQIPDEQVGKLFDKFYVAGSTGRSKYGTGIGLAFTREMVSLLNGRIEAESQDGWITFRVVIPVPDAEVEDPQDDAQLQSANPSSFLFKSMSSAPATSALSAAENNKQAFIDGLQSAERKSILIVEDEAAIRFLLNDILKDSYTIYEAESGEQALELILKVIPDLIISDVMMPGMTGLELCNKIRNAPATCHIPFVILSAKGGIEQRTEGYEVGVDAYIAKPFHVGHLKVRIRKLLEHRERMQELFNTNDSSTDLLVDADLAENDKEFLNKLLAVIEKNLDEPELNAAWLENALMLSKMQLYRKLKTLTDMTPGEFIKTIRLKRAVQLLVSTNLTVTEIFYRTGFNNQSYFFREFKKRYDCAPAEYRAQQQVQV